ncbi:MAG: ribulose-phosphate 3-epimerase [Mollicutes bacterium]|nr:ribulose-phosphate 3-epimerase [Mollicutes bacterium]
MKISASFLSITDNVKENIEILDKTDIDYLHLDIMDSIFVDNKTYSIDEIKFLLENTTKPKDVHLMVSDVKKYIDDFKTIDPEFITFHYEAVDDPQKIIDYVKKEGIKVGISIKPKTQIKEIIPYLPFIDLVLIMSVVPGRGGQKFIKNVISKVEKLNNLKKEYGYKFVVEIDGGINDQTILYCQGVDIVVVGSFITNSDNYKRQVEKLREKIIKIS